MNLSNLTYGNRLLLASGIIIGACVPQLFVGPPIAVPLLPWSWIAWVFVMLRLPFGWYDYWMWPTVLGILTGLLLAISAKWNWSTVAATGWFLLNILAGYLLFSGMSHS